MKEAVGGTWLFGIVITFIIFFTSYISMSTNYAKAFKVKDELLLTIEHYKGVNTKSISRINKFMKDIGYFSTGNCNGYKDVDESSLATRFKFTEWYGFDVGPAGNPGSSTKNDKTANYCIRRSKFASGDNDAGHPRSAHYQVVVFFTLDWPIVGALLNVRIEGETSIIHMNCDEGKFIPCINNGVSSCSCDIP